MLRLANGINRFNDTTKTLYNGLLKQFTLRSVDVNSKRNFEQNLPQLPVPNAEKLLQIYVKSVKPFLSNEEFAKTMKLVSTFGNENGNLLQQYALKRAEEMDNWQTDYWVHDIFLNIRNTVIYSNPVHLCENLHFKNETDRINYTATFISGVLDFKEQIEEAKLPIEMMGRDPQDMSQFKSVFSSCRMPGFQRDYIHVSPYTNYIVVVCNNHFYKVPVYNAAKEVVSVRQLESILQQILELSVKDTVPVGILTSDHRDNFYAAYDRLKNYPENLKALADVRDALFLVCLDNNMDENVKWEQSGGSQILHGGGSKYNTGNRWFDKCMQIIIGKDGTVGMNIEHSLFDGTPIFTLFNYVTDNMDRKKYANLTDAVNVEPLNRIEFKLDAKLLKFIDRSKENADKLAKNLEVQVFVFNSFGKSFLKSRKLNIDCFLQMAIQYAYYSLHGEPGAQLEVASIRKFLKGRTNTVRSCSVESVAFAKCMLDSRTSDEDKLNALKVAIKSHKESIVQTINGYAVDDYLVALRKIALEKKLKLPSLYEDKSYLISGHMKLVTSQVSYKQKVTAFYYPLVEDGYSCTYNIHNSEIYFGILANNSCPSTSAEKFRETLRNCLMNMHALLRRTNE